MSITLHWWMWPIGIMVLAILLAWDDANNSSGNFPGMFSPFFILIGIAASVGICLGHWS